MWYILSISFFFTAVHMECYAGGFPTPKISWRRENNAILPTGGSIYRGNTLKISKIRKEDRGIYIYFLKKQLSIGIVFIILNEQWY